MIQLSNAGKRFGHKLLYENLNWLITPNERSGLVGGNGTGKSTLLKVIGGMDTLDMGDLTQTKGVTTGYLPQDGLSLSGRTVFTEVMSVFDRLRALEVEMEALTHSMPELDPSTPEYAAVADRFHRIESEFTAHDGYALESQAGTVLTGLGFKKEDWTRRTEEFSGGWQMRISLAKLLLEKPNMLLLDEPTNHLDLEARNWLEDYLKNYPYAFILISHDRYFLDVTVNKIVEIWNKGVHFYSGNYEKFLTEKEMRKTTLEAAYKNQHGALRQTAPSSYVRTLARSWSGARPNGVRQRRGGGRRSCRRRRCRLQAMMPGPFPMAGRVPAPATRAAYMLATE